MYIAMYIAIYIVMYLYVAKFHFRITLYITHCVYLGLSLSHPPIYIAEGGGGRKS